MRQRPEIRLSGGYDEFGARLDLTIDRTPAHQRFRRIEPGTFVMGSPPDESGRFANEALREVTVESPFWIADTPCTRALWTTFMSDPLLAGTSVSGHEPLVLTLPPWFTRVNHGDIIEFNRRLSACVPGFRARLPRESEWEYACRAGTTTARYGALDEIAWYQWNSPPKIQRAALKTPNAWGLHDMLGNVWELCERDDPQDHPDSRIIRGGHWLAARRYVRAAFRQCTPAHGRFDDLGFRVVLEPDPQQENPRHGPGRDAGLLG